jgi:hypothetical protein
MSWYEKFKEKVQHHSIRAWSPTALLTGPCVACLCRSDGMQNFQRGMVVPINLVIEKSFMTVKSD